MVVDEEQADSQGRWAVNVIEAQHRCCLVQFTCSRMLRREVYCYLRAMLSWCSCTANRPFALPTSQLPATIHEHVIIHRCKQEACS